MRRARRAPQYGSRDLTALRTVVASSVTRLRATLRRTMPASRLAILWLATCALMFQAIVPTHLVGTPADPLDRIILASLCHPGQDGAPDPSGPDDPSAKTCPQCIFCIPGHSLLAPQQSVLRLPGLTHPHVLVPQWTAAPEFRREHERPAARAPPATA
ncbi:MAG: hypothetical protein HXX10_11480 [Rhodoplanes sp.]|uniref:hypothetical protein n=1 Tax=Rhodoplanes sp. TaxID=1968906 RepID=UPI0017CB9132|nr:hypothetical protein [Rhodoplanes sp.]NVO14648.1 hypothetical protein [Rhodoplanes sp.]